MGEALREPSESNIEEADGYLRVEFNYGTANEISAIYRALAVRCIGTDVKRVLVKPGDADPAGERALRDAFTMMLLAGLPFGFKIALVINRPGVEARYRVCVRDLCLANVNAAGFSDENDAVRWLTHGDEGIRQAP